MRPTLHTPYHTHAAPAETNGTGPAPLPDTGLSLDSQACRPHSAALPMTWEHIGGQSLPPESSTHAVGGAASPTQAARLIGQHGAGVTGTAQATGGAGSPSGIPGTQEVGVTFPLTTTLFWTMVLWKHLFPRVRVPTRWNHNLSNGRVWGGG
jgi:hypothetical protein